MRKAISIALCAYAARLLAQTPPTPRTPGTVALVPIEMYNKSPYVQVRVAGFPRPLVFLLNPSSVPTYIDKTIAAGLGLTTHTETDFTTPTMTLGGAVLPLARFTVVDLSPDIPGAGRPFDGILGSDLFSHYVVEVDHEVGLLRLFDPASFHYYGAGQALTLHLVDGRPYVEATLQVTRGRAVIHQYRLDFGTGDAINDDAFKSLVKAGDNLPDLGRAQLLQIGDVRFTGVNGTGGGPLLGEELLHRFNLTFDYAHHRVFFEPTRHLHDAFVFDMSGLSYVLTPNLKAILIERVARGTPGEDAGVRPGDIITEIDSASVQQLGLETVLRMFEEPHRYELTVQRGTTLLHVPLHLRKLL